MVGGGHPEAVFLDIFIAEGGEGDVPSAFSPVAGGAQGSPVGDLVVAPLRDGCYMIQLKVVRRLVQPVLAGRGFNGVGVSAGLTPPSGQP